MYKLLSDLTFATGEVVKAQCVFIGLQIILLFHLTKQTPTTKSTLSGLQKVTPQRRLINVYIKGY